MQCSASTSSSDSPTDTTRLSFSLLGSSARMLPASASNCSMTRRRKPSHIASISLGWFRKAAMSYSAPMSRFCAANWAVLSSTRCSRLVYRSCSSSAMRL
ncbi:hypothetical protein D3C81_1943350 [compost metagenome]